MGDLYDFYGPLLTERQRQIIEMYHIEDWSLSEIAELLSISRQAVHDQLRRASEQLEMFEQVLHMLATSRKQRVWFREIEQVWLQIEPSVNVELKQRMRMALKEALATLPGTAGGDVDA